MKRKVVSCKKAWLAKLHTHTHPTRFLKGKQTHDYQGYRVFVSLFLMEKEPFSPEIVSHAATQRTQCLQTSAFQTLEIELFSLGSQQLMGNAHSFWELDTG